MDDTTSARTNARLWMAAFFVATFGTAALIKTGVVPGWRGLALFGASFLLLIPLVRSAERARAARGITSAAIRAYNRRMIVASLVYVAFLLGGVTIARYYFSSVPARILLAIAAAAPVLFMIWAVVLLIRDETDEYLRKRMVEQSLIATGFVLALTTVYGFLNAFDLAPRLDAYLVAPLWGAGLGIGRLMQRDGPC